MERIPANRIPLGLLIAVQCDCARTAPTYPVYRERPHLPDCVWDEVQLWAERCVEMRLEYLGTKMPGRS